MQHPWTAVVDNRVYLWTNYGYPQAGCDQTMVTHRMGGVIHRLSSVSAQAGMGWRRTPVHRVIPRLWTTERVHTASRWLQAGYADSTGVDNPVHDPVGNRVDQAFRGLPRLVADPVGELGDLVVDRPALRHQLTDLAVGMHDRGVVASSEQLADLR